MTTESLRVGLVQMNSGADKALNLTAALKGIKEAAEKGATFVLLPEVF